MGFSLAPHLHWVSPEITCVPMSPVILPLIMARQRLSRKLMALKKTQVINKSFFVLHSLFCERTSKPARIRYHFPLEDVSITNYKLLISLYSNNHVTGRVFTTFRILEISYISNVFFVLYTIRKWPKFREIIRNFSLQIYTKFRGISRNSVTCYTNFFNDSAQTTFSTHSRETSRRWLGVGEVRQYTQPLPLHCCQ